MDNNQLNRYNTIKKITKLMSTTKIDEEIYKNKNFQIGLEYKYIKPYLEYNQENKSLNKLKEFYNITIEHYDDLYKNSVYKYILDKLLEDGFYTEDKEFSKTILNLVKAISGNNVYYIK